MPKSAALQILSKKKAEAAETPSAEAEQAATPGEEVDTAPEAAEAEPAPNPKVTVTKAKGSTKAKEAKGETVATQTKTKVVADEIVDTAATIENLTEAAAFKELNGLLESQSFDEFRMGGILAKIQVEGWLGEHPNFRSLVEAEFGIKYRTAMMWVAMYNNLVESGVSYSKLKRLGWTKIALLAPILTQDNVEEIVPAIEGMTALQVGEFVRNFNAGTASASSIPSDVSELKSKTFKLFPGQKESVELALDKAKKDASTDSDSAALEFICIDFASGTKKKAAATKTTTEVKVPETKDEFVAVFKSKREGAEDLQTALTDILEAVNEVFPEAQIEVELAE